MIAGPVVAAAKKAVGLLAVTRSTPTKEAIEAWHQAMRDFAVTCARSVAGRLSDEAKTAVSQLIGAGLLYEQSGAEPLTFVQFMSAVLGLTPETTAATAQVLREFVTTLSTLSVLQEADTPCQH